MNIAVRSFNTLNIVSSSEKLFTLFDVVNDTPLIDRLYRRYVKHEDNEQTLALLISKAQMVKNSLLNEFVEKLAAGIKNSEYFSKYGEYYPIRLCIHDTFYSIVEENIPLEDYDNLEGDPLWMRPEYMLEKYG